MVKKYGYIRVSTKKQNQARQTEEMRRLGIEEDNLFSEKESGQNFNRAVYGKLRKILKEGDSLYIESVDRLGRTYKGIVKEWKYLAGHKKINIRVIDNPLLDTVDDAKLITVFLKDILLLIGAYQAEQEYISIKERQAQGIAIAKKKGKKFGRPKKDISQKELDIAAKWRAGGLTSKEAMLALELKRSAFYNLIEKIEQNTE